jgi:hypothetical protein
MTRLLMVDTEQCRVMAMYFAYLGNDLRPDLLRRQRSRSR